MILILSWGWDPVAWSQGRDEEVPRTKRWKTPGFLHQEEEAGPVEETVTEARGMQSGGSTLYLQREESKHFWLCRPYRCHCTHCLLKATSGRPGRMNVAVAMPGARKVSINKEPRSGVGPSAVTFTIKIWKPWAGQSLSMWAPYSRKYFKKNYIDSVVLNIMLVGQNSIIGMHFYNFRKVFFKSNATTLKRYAIQNESI